jgi:hypothetical protein
MRLSFLSLHVFVTTFIAVCLPVSFLCSEATILLKRCHPPYQTTRRQPKLYTGIA